MAEAQKGFATLEDVDEGTFIRFIEWAHRGFYTAAEYSTLVEEDPDTAGSRTDDDQASNNGAIPDAEDKPEALLDEDDWAGYQAPVKKNKSKGIKLSHNPPPPTAREDLIQSFVSRKPVERKSAIGIPPPRRNQSSAEDYSDVFLSHARLYVFAEKYDIQPLKMLALDELHAVLAIFTLYLERTEDIVDLLRYVYANTGEPREGVEDMRTLMTHYVGYEMETLIKDTNFRDLMIEDQGDLLGDFMDMVGKRIS